LSSRERHPADLLRLVVGGTIFAVGAVVVRGRVPSRLEIHAFRLVNDLPGGFRIPAETVMRLGTALAVVLVGAIALGFGCYRMALAALVAGFAGNVASHFMREVVGRGRPLDLLTHVVVRGPRITGFGYPSGHTTTAAALVAATTPYLPRWARCTAWTAVGFVALARVYVGAHLPLDVVGGAALGLAIGSAVNLGLGTP
jgi:membrane-associated phospholipid phosphatase